MNISIYQSYIKYLTKSNLLLIQLTITTNNTEIWDCVPRSDDVYVSMRKRRGFIVRLKSLRVMHTYPAQLYQCVGKLIKNPKYPEH
jgi:hypothetical protein